MSTALNTRRRLSVRPGESARRALPAARRQIRKKGDMRTDVMAAIRAARAAAIKGSDEGMRMACDRALAGDREGVDR